MWSGPRNVSTAFMRSWENRPDTIVVDEPFYAHYLAVTGLDHPGRDEILAHHESDWRRVVQSLLAPLQLQGDVQLFWQWLVIGLLGQRHQVFDLALELRLETIGVLPAQCLVLAGIGFDLGAVQTDGAELDQAQGLGDQQDLDEQGFELLEKALPEVGDGAVIRMGVGADEAKRDRVVAGLRKLATGEHPSGVAVEQQRHQQCRVVGFRARAGVGTHQVAEIQLIDDVHNEARQVLLGQVVLHT